MIWYDFYNNCIFFRRACLVNLFCPKSRQVRPRLQREERDFNLQHFQFPNLASVWRSDVAVFNTWWLTPIYGWCLMEKFRKTMHDLGLPLTVEPDPDLIRSHHFRPGAEAHQNPAMHRDCFSASNSWHSSSQGENVGSTRAYNGAYNGQIYIDITWSIWWFQCTFRKMITTPDMLKTFDDVWW